MKRDEEGRRGVKRDEEGKQPGMGYSIMIIHSILEKDKTVNITK